MHILFICTGNTCRSPMAAGFYNQLAATKGESFAQSAGLAVAMEGECASENACKAAAEFGVDLRAHRAQQVTPELIAAADQIYCMTPAHAAKLCAAVPYCADKVNILLPPGGVPDPYGGDIEEYRACACILRSAVAAIPGL